MSVLDDLKCEYNYNLKRYKNGCDYCAQHPNETQKWLPELLSIMNNANDVLKEIMKIEQISDDEILNGFKGCENYE